MATIRGPKGRMTQPLVTPYDVGDAVMLTIDADCDGVPDGHGQLPRPGDVGVIRRIFIACPNDGDDTFLGFSIEFDGWSRLLNFAEDEIAPAREANAWLLRQLNGLNSEEAR